MHQQDTMAGTRFPKMRKFKPQCETARAMGMRQVREYVDYDAPMPITYRLSEADDGRWSWDRLMHGWSLGSSDPDANLMSFEEAYQSLRERFSPSGVASSPMPHIG